jgi:NAD(P)-dependent dehydrogenase (short-subunit alcohol dehydrogenase family)
MRVVILGGGGNFGARICRALWQDPAFEVIPAGRSAPAARLDICAPEFEKDLSALHPGLVIHCAGPFQGQDYRVARAALAAGAHYLDLADGHEFVARFRERNGATAKAADRIALSGASTLPALSAAVIDGLRPHFAQLEEIQIVIAPAQRAPRGAATLAGVFSYAGKPFKVLREGAWADAWGWQELRRVRIEGLGARWAAVCDVPDLELLPARYPGVKTVEFRAALEVGIQHFALSLAAGLRRAGLPLPLELWAAPLDKLASWLDVFGSERGGMVVSVTGRSVQGGSKRLEWHLVADHNHGPEIPCMPAILLARRIARNEIAERGAYPCMGFLDLEEFAPEFARWGMKTTIQEHDA